MRGPTLKGSHLESAAGRMQLSQLSGFGAGDEGPAPVPTYRDATFCIPFQGRNANSLMWGV